MFWERKLDKTPLIDEMTRLPSYSHSFFLKHMGSFKTSFVVLTVITIISTTSRFIAVYLLSDLLSNVLTTSSDDLIYFYLPFFLGLILLAEFLDYFKRKYAEALPDTYSDYIRLRFYKTILNSRFERIFGFSKEKLNRVVNMYIEDVHKVLSDWIWQTVTFGTQLVIIAVILAVLNPIVLLVNFVLITIFLVISFRISRDFSKYAKKQTKVQISADSTIDSFTLNLNSVRKNQLIPFFVDSYRLLIEKKWDALKDVRDFHSKRWLIQLVLFQLIHIGTLFYSLFLVIEGSLDLGFVLLVEWAYSQLWYIMVFVIEYRVLLLQQKENARVANNTFKKILTNEARKTLKKDWNGIELENASITFKKGKGKEVEIKIPSFTLQKGNKIGVTGRSGSGKSTLLYILLGLVNYEGELIVDGEKMPKDMQIDTTKISIIDNESPFFNISLRENLLLGRKINPERFSNVLESLKVLEFEKDFSKNYGESISSYSAGQMQRLRLARGVLQESDIYLLDEPFNGIDKQNKEEILTFMKDFLNDKTVVLVTHLKEEFDLVDELYEVKGGVVSKREIALIS